MEVTVKGELMLPNEKVSIEIYGDSKNVSHTYNSMKETIIAAEEERRAKLDKEKEESD